MTRTELQRQNTRESMRALAAPPVRKLARELGVDLSGVAGTGPGGRVTAADVRASVAAAALSPSDRREPLRGVRRAMARNLADAWREVPHISLFDELDARRVARRARSTSKRATTASR